MIAARLSENEDERLQELLKYEILDSPEEEELNDIVKLASYVCEAPIALISLLDDCRQWFKAEVGLNQKEMDRETSFCAHALHYDNVMVVEDALKDERFYDNPIVIGGPEVRFYAGAPLVSPKGLKIGTLCVLDRIPRSLTDEQAFALETLSRHVVQKFELKKKSNNLSQLFQQYLSLQTEFNNKQKAYAQAQKTADIGIFELDVMADKLKGSGSFCELFGLAEDEDLSWKDIQQLVHPNDSLDFIAFFANVIKNETQFKYEYRSIRKDTNKEVCIRSTGEVERNKSGKAVRIIGVKQDISEKRRNEVELKKQNEELLKVNHELDHFVSRVSHDLRAPISTVLGLIELILKHETNVDKIKELLVLVKKSLEKQDDFIRDILNYSRNSRMPPNPEEIQMEELLAEIFSHLQYSYDSEKVKYLLSVEQDTRFVSDKSRLFVILTNLVSNAIKYLNKQNDQNLVSVQVKVTEEEAVIKVEDTGIGIEEKHLPKVFDMFYRATDKKPGSGLGLYIVKESVKKLKGKIRLESVVGEGTIVTLHIPNMGAK